MATWGSCDFHELEDFKKRLENIDADKQKFLESCVNELAQRMLSKVIKRTPVGVYEEGSGKTGGTLRRGWTGNESSNAKKYADSISVRKSGSNYTIEIVNPVEYASYVEYGHRTRNHKGWVPGKFMMTISEKEVNNLAPALLQKKLEKFLKEVFNA